MSLRQTATKDLAVILEDASGFAWPIELTAPDGTVRNLQGISSDISQMIDPETGGIVSGRSASIAIRTALLIEQFPTQGLPRGIADTGTKPWLVKFEDINGQPYIFKIAESNPDRTLGLISFSLELYSRNAPGVPGAPHRHGALN